MKGSGQTGLERCRHLFSDRSWFDQRRAAKVAAHLTVVTDQNTPWLQVF